MPQFRKILITTLSTLVALQPVLQAASSVPTGGTFTAGSGKITTSGNVVTIDQNSWKGIIDWNSFSIGAASTVTFNNGSGATLNRVTGTTPTTILGQLLATGNIYLLNPEGVLVGHGATVHTGGDFLAGTLSIPNSAFLSNAPLPFTGSAQATVVNLGNITSDSGNIYLIGHAVQNQGAISSPNGTTALAAGSQVLIADTSTGQKVAVQAPGGDVTNAGFLSAAQIELKSNGGNIYALAGNNGGQIQATGTAVQNGHVWLIANNGAANVSGTITASNADGTGGAIETSGAHVLTSGATIKTGKNGNWLLDPDDLTINSTLAGTIETTLNNGTNVTEQTTASGTGGSGDITVASNIAWTGSADLTLSAYRGIGFNPGVVISNNGAGNLTLRADNASTGTGTVLFSGANQIDFHASTGSVALLYNPSSYSAPTNYSTNFGSVNNSWSAPANGTVSGQYTAYMLVNSLANLQSIDANDAGTYALGQNIDASATSSTPFTPLGNSTAFNGIFDGQGHSITGVNITASSGNVGLFAQVALGGIVRNLNLVGFVISQSGTAQTNTGTLIGLNHGLVSNDTATGNINTGTSFPYNVGGLVGYNNTSGTIQFSSASVSLNSSANTNTSAALGGLVGENEATIKDSSATGSIVLAGSYDFAGGLVGIMGSGNISNSYAQGSVTAGTSSQVGGFGGEMGGTVSSSYSTGAVAAGSSSHVAGFIGSSTAAITSSYWDSQTSGFPSVGLGSGSSTGLTPQTTAQLQSGARPSGFSSSHWDIVAGLYPFLTWQGTVISGDVYNGSSPLSSVSVDALANGVNLGAAVTNANGLYTLVLPSSSLAGVSGILAYLPGTIKGNSFSNGDGSGNFTGTNIYAGTLFLSNRTDNTYTGIVAALQAALGSNSGSSFLFAPNGSNITLTAGTNLSINSQLALNLDQSISTSGAVTMVIQGDLNQSQPVTAGALGLTGSSNINLGQANSIGTLAGTAGGNLAVTNAGDLTATAITAGGTVGLTSTTGSLTIAPGSTITASGSGTALQLSAGSAFINLGGSGALNVASGGGRWLVFSQNPASDTRGGLAYGFKQYDYAGAVAQSTGNGFIYTYAPMLTLGLTGTTSKTYDGTTSASLTSSNYTIAGGIDGDSISLLSTPILGTYADPNVGSSKAVSAAGFSLSNLSISNGSAAIYGYQLASGTATGNIGSISPATLVYTANPATQTYGSGNTAFTGTITGFVNGETLASATTGTPAFTSSTTASSQAGTYGIFGSGLSANHGNYSFSQATTNATALTIIGAAATPVMPGQTTLTIAVNNVTAAVGQTPSFKPTYVGSPVSGLNIAFVLSGLTYQITPSLNGPGTYSVTATGTAPSGYSFNFVPGSLTLIDSSPVTLPSLVTFFKPDVPSLLLLPESGETSNFLQPDNALGQFQMDSSGTASSAPPDSLSHALFFSAAHGKSERFVAGARP